MSNPPRTPPLSRQRTQLSPADSSTRVLLFLARARVLSAVLLLAAITFACSQASTDARKELVVYAASSLTEVLPRIADAFEAQNPDAGSVVFNFAGSATLRSQLDFGAPADIFVSANAAQMDLAVASGVIEGVPIAFATNAITVVVPRGSPRIDQLDDLAEPGVRIVLASEQVPAGAYTRMVLANLNAARPGLADGVMANVVSEETNVREVLAKVVLGEADAGFVYVTDATGGPNSDQVTVVPVPDEARVAATYLAGRVVGTGRSSSVDAFIAFLGSDESIAILADAGFGAPSAMPSGS